MCFFTAKGFFWGKDDCFRNGKSKTQRRDAATLRETVSGSERLFYLLAGGIEGAERRFDEELAVAEELADVGIICLNVVKACEMPFRAVVLYTEKFRKIV